MFIQGVKSFGNPCIPWGLQVVCETYILGKLLCMNFAQRKCIFFPFFYKLFETSSSFISFQIFLKSLREWLASISCGQLSSQPPSLVPPVQCQLREETQVGMDNSTTCVPRSEQNHPSKEAGKVRRGPRMGSAFSSSSSYPTNFFIISTWPSVFMPSHCALGLQALS